MAEVKIEFTSNLAKVMSQYTANKKAGLTAMGAKAVELTVEQMNTGYGKPIYETGDLIRSISANVGSDSVDVGSNMEYAPWVHNGTSRMAARPFLRDALTKGENQLSETYADYAGKGMD